jgi:hypothetical protein
MKTSTYNHFRPSPGPWTVWQLPCMISGSHEPDAVPFVAREPEAQARDSKRRERWKAAVEIAVDRFFETKIKIIVLTLLTYAALC